MDKGSQLASFVLRFSRMVSRQKDESGAETPHWRIRVTHVQSNNETVVNSLEEAMQYIGRIVERDVGP
jgi:hypothetical protein